MNRYSIKFNRVEITITQITFSGRRAEHIKNPKKVWLRKKVNLHNHHWKQIESFHYSKYSLFTVCKPNIYYSVVGSRLNLSYTPYHQA